MHLGIPKVHRHIHEATASRDRSLVQCACFPEVVDRRQIHLLSHNIKSTAGKPRAIRTLPRYYLLSTHLLDLPHHHRTSWHKAYLLPTQQNFNFVPDESLPLILIFDTSYLYPIGPVRIIPRVHFSVHSTLTPIHLSTLGVYHIWSHAQPCLSPRTSTDFIKH